MEQRAAAPAGVDDELRRRPARTPRAPARRAARSRRPVVQEGSARTEQGAVEIAVDAAQRGAHGDLVCEANGRRPRHRALGRAAPGRARGRAARDAVGAEPPARRARSPCPRSCTPACATALAARGIERLYSHQAQALHAAWAGPTIVTTGTASGKSLCFQLPTLDVLCRDAKARALYLYPSKALAQDQARALHAFGVDRVRQAIYDGDTPREQRSAIRRRANVVLTNPDMLHLGILPNHRAWARLLRQPRARRRRRGARLPRRVRLARRQRAAAAAAGRRRLRDRAALRAGQRDDRQPGASWPSG